MDRSNGVETSIPGTTIPEDSQPAQPVPSVLYNRGGNVALQNEAGSIYRRPDGRTVLVGANGQTLVTGADDSDEDTSFSDEDQLYAGRNVIIKGGKGQGFINEGTVIISQTGEGTIQTFKNYRLQLVNGGLRLTVEGKNYDFPAKDASVNSKEQIDINGQKATLQYDNGNIVVELADGTVMAKAEGGLFSGNRYSYDNRKQIQANAAQDIAHLQTNLAQLEKNITQEVNQAIQNIGSDLTFNLGNLNI